MSNVSRHPSLVVDNAKLEDITRFLSDNAESGKKLYAKTENGQTVLYLKSGSNFLDHLRPGSNFMSNHMSRAAEKQLAARTVLANAVSHSVGEFNAGGSSRNGLNQLLGNIGLRNDGQALHQSQNRDSASVLKAIKSLESFKGTLPQHRPDAAYQAPSAKATLGTEAVLSSLPASKSNDLVRLADTMGERMIRNYRSASPEARADFVVALADEKSFKATLKSELLASPSSGARFAQDPTTDALVNAVYDSISEQVPSGKIVDGGTKSIAGKTPFGGDRNYDADTVEIGGKTYEPVKFLSAGSFGAAFLYESLSGEQMVVKLPILDTDASGEELAEATRETGNELRNFARIGEGDHENVVGFKGGVRMPNGAYAIAMEYAPNGTVGRVGEKIADDVKSGALSNAEAKIVRLTLIKDMAEGVAHMHDQAQSTHYDFKTANCLVGADGRAKIMDFGTSFDAPSRTLGDAKEIDNPAWKAPEILYGERVFQPKMGEMQADMAKHELANALKAYGFNNDQVEEISQSVVNKANLKDGRRRDNEFRTDEKVDVWSLGMSSIEMLLGYNPISEMNTNFNAQREQSVLDFYGRGGAAITNDGTASFAPTTNDPALDAFVNTVLVADPALRPSARSVADNAVFTQKGVGSEGARELIKALALPNADAQTARITALDKQLAALKTEELARATDLSNNFGFEDQDTYEEALNAVLQRQTPLDNERTALIAERSPILDIRNAAIAAAQTKLAAELAA